MNIVAKPIQFVKEVRTELGKVAWSTRQEVLAATGVVIMTTLILGVYIGILDLMLSKFLRLLFQ